MTFPATVARILIASPGDVAAERDTIERALYGWNDSRAEREELVLMPWRWENSAVPVVGDHPQTIINLQGVDSADVVFAVFGSRLGQATEEAVSGTVEEIDRAVDRGIPVHVYFSTAPVPHDVDTEQLDALREFKKALEQHALYKEFLSLSELGHLVWQAIDHDLPQFSRKKLTAQTLQGVLFVPKMHVDRRTEVDSKGKPRNKTDRWIEVLNDSNTDAEEVVFSVVGDTERLLIQLPGNPRSVTARQPVRLPILASGGTGDWKLRIEWKENGEERAKEYSVV